MGRRLAILSAGLTLLLFLDLISIGAADSTFQRPWENKSWIITNPSIWNYGFEYWWNLPELHKTVESIDTGKQLQISNPARNYLTLAEKAAISAQADKSRCIHDAVAAIGFLPSNPTAAYLRVFSNSSSCRLYQRDWTKSVDYYLLSIESSITASSNSINEARESFEETKFMGLCSKNYTYAGSENCAELQNAFSTVDHNITEGKYGKYALLANYSNQLDIQLSKPTPDLSISFSMLGLVWGNGGILQTFAEVKNKSETAKSNARQEYQQKLQSVSARKSMAEKNLHDLESERIFLISSAPSGYTSHTVGSISKRFSSLKNKSGQLSILFSEAQLEYKRTTTAGYLANAIVETRRLDDEYLQLTTAASLLRDHAEQTVEQTKNEAETEISQTQSYLSSSSVLPAGSDAFALAAQANTSFASGGLATNFGDKFLYYSKAAALARAARNSRLLEQELANKSSISLLRSLLERAERDQINIISEKEALSLIASLQPYSSDALVQNSISNLISKARIKYENDLMATRSRIYDKLLLAGSGASDLYTDMHNYEEGIIESNSILFPDSIGSLKKLKSNYALLESTLDAYASDIVGNSLSTKASPLITNVWLDSPAGITLDVVVSNNRPYNATHATSTVVIDSSIPFLYTDITLGKDSVEAFRTADYGKTLFITFQSVRAFETKHIRFEKQYTIAHTIKNETKAEGLGDGSAYVTQKIDFILDSDVKGLSLPSEFNEATIDGGDSGKQLTKGSHSLVSERIVPHAYTETISNIKAYPLGINSRVEFDVRLDPEMNLDNVLVIINALNDSSVNSLNIFAAGGEAVKDKIRISETQYSAKVFGLKKDRTTVLKVSYYVENTEAFVKGQLARLSGINMSSNVRELINKAQIQANSGNYTRALELIEQSVALADQDTQASNKLQQRHNALSSKIQDELSKLESIPTSNLSAPLIQKLSARKVELERILLEANNSDINRSLTVLEKVDYGWLDKTINSFKKEAYTSYNDLKERFYKAGNQSTPQEFLNFEYALNKLESGGRLEYAIETLTALSAVEAVVINQENITNSAVGQLKSSLELLKSETLNVFNTYSKQASAAKGTEYSGLFTETSQKISKLIKDAEDALKMDQRMLVQRMNALNLTKEQMENTLASLKNESESKLRLLESVIQQKKLNDEKKNAFASKLDSIRKMISDGEYVNALRAGTVLANALNGESQSEDYGLLVLGATVTAVLSGACFYVAKQPKQKKELKKLSSVCDSQTRVLSGGHSHTEPAKQDQKTGEMHKN